MYYILGVYTVQALTHTHTNNSGDMRVHGADVHVLIGVCTVLMCTVLMCAVLMCACRVLMCACRVLMCHQIGEVSEALLQAFQLKLGHPVTVS